MPRLCLLILVTVLALTLSSAAATQTLLYLNSQPGDWVGGGVQQTFTPADGPFTVTMLASGGIQIFFHTTDYSHFWNLQFGPPYGQKLAVGEYEGIQRFAFHSPTMPGLDVSGDGRGCNTDTGRFLVSNIAYNLDGTLAKLAMDFEQHCEGATPALYGSVRYNSAITLAPRFGIGNATALKGNVGNSDANVILSLSMPSSNAVSVQYATADGTAIQGTDYVATSGTVTFPANVTSMPITIPILGDRMARGNKTFHVLLSNGSGALIGDKTANVKILDPNIALTVLSMYGQPGDYISPGRLLLTIADGTFTPSRNYDNGVNVAFRGLDWWETDFAAPNNATLTAGTYLNAQRFPFQAAGLPGLSVYGAGRGCNTLTGSFTVLQTSYDTSGNVKHFAADFEQHCEGATAGLFGSIRISSKWRQLSVSDAVIDNSQATATFSVTLNPSKATSVSVNFSTVDGTAIAGIDYVPTSETVTFSAGETVHSVTVPLLTLTPGKVFYGQLSAPSGAPIWINQGSATF